MSDSYKYNIDSISYKNGILKFRGWVFNTDKLIKNIKLVVFDGKETHKQQVNVDFSERDDVYDKFKNENAKKCGFFYQIQLKNVYKDNIFLELNDEKQIFVGHIENNEVNNLLFKIKHKIKMYLNIYERVEIQETGINIPQNKLKEFISNNTNDSITYNKNIYNFTIDIIIPVYNGYEYLKSLFASIPNTKMNYRLIVINDNSSDKRISDILNKYKNTMDNFILIENEENIGFVKSVNKGLTLSENNVVLLNTDTELPSMWLERLMSPILLNEKIATTTPFTNSGTICSFPNFCENNEIFEGLGLKTIDEAFIKIKPIYTEMPTGVGFCMGMNKEVINKIGLLDEKSFDKGYCEENDWCQRAIEAGYKNVHVENLFVYHKHGGSFLSDEKKILMDRNYKKLLKKHPDYNSDVMDYCSIDPVKNIRKYVICKLLFENIKNVELYFDHSSGGGATSFLENSLKKRMKESILIVVVRYDYFNRKYIINIKYKDYDIVYFIEDYKEMIGCIEKLNIKSIFVNELVTYENLYLILHDLLRLKSNNKASLYVYIHDYYYICPTVNLLNKNGYYCGLNNKILCNKCLENNKFNFYKQCKDIDLWRSEWNDFLENCEEVIVFSNDSQNIIKGVYKNLNNIVVRPHNVNYITPIKMKTKIKSSLNIGILGALTYHKGFNIVQQILEIIDEKKLDINITLIGEIDCEEELNYKKFKKTGCYSIGEMDKLVNNNNIDVFLIPTVWPETYSFTTQEIIMMEMPVACLNIGAQAEKVKKYSKGLIIDSFDANVILDEIINFMEKYQKNSFK